MFDEKKFHKYLKEVENYFIKKRGTPFILSSEDVQLILYWFKKGVPSSVVKKGIEEVFERLKEKEKFVNSIKYCAQRIEELHKEEKRKLSRSWHGEEKDFDLNLAFEKNLNALREFFKKNKTFENKEKKILKKIENLKNIKELEKIEENLKKIEEKIIEHFYKELSLEEKESIKKEIEKEIPAEVKNLPKFVKNSMIKMIFFEKIKKEKNVPTLTLLL